MPVSPLLQSLPSVAAPKLNVPRRKVTGKIRNFRVAVQEAAKRGVPVTTLLMNRKKAA